MQDRFINGPKDAQYTFLFAHGAGAGMDTHFMEYIAHGLAANGIRVVRFEFPYMKTVRKNKKRRPPNPLPVLRSTFLSEIEQLSGPVVIGGKSMGGRVASMILRESRAKACVALGYPFHPPGKPNKLRVEHLAEIKKPILIVQGMRDPFGKPEEKLESYLPKNGSIHWLIEGDHSFSTRKSAQRRTLENLEEAVASICLFFSTL